MAPEKRSAHPSVKDLLFEEFYSYTFYQAVRLLEELGPRGGEVGRTLTPAAEAVRFSVRPGFSFPPSDISGLRVPEGESQPLLEAAFLGLVGPSGVLPQWYNELALERRNQKDGAFTSFLDMFQHRLLSLFYLAWKKHQLPLNYRVDARDRISFYLRSMIGLGTEGLSGRVGLPEEAPMFQAGVFLRRVPTASAVTAAVSYYFRVRAELEQFVPRLITLPRSECTRIGQANSRLGVDSICGSQVWENQTRFCLNLGPMPFADYVRFLPSGDRLEPLFSLVRFQVGIEYEFDVRVILNREEVPACRLGVGGGAAGRLGWSVWVKSDGVPLESDPHATFQMKEMACCA